MWVHPLGPHRARAPHMSGESLQADMTGICGRNSTERVGRQLGPSFYLIDVYLVNFFTVSILELDGSNLSLI